MDYYIPLILYIIVVSFFFKEKKAICYILTAVPLILFWGTKVDFGPDYAGYLFKFESQHDLPVQVFLMEAMKGKFEPGFFFLLKVMPSFNAVVFVTSTFLIGSVFVFLDEFVPQKAFPLALFLWLFNSSIFNTFSAMRSSFVIGFFLLAVVAKTRSKNLVAIFLTLLGAQFHMSGYLLILFTILPLRFYKVGNKFFVPIIILFICIALLMPSFFSQIVSGVISSNENISAYEDYITNTSYGIGFYIFSFFRIGFIIYIINLINKSIIEEKFIWIAWLTVFCYLFMMMQGINIMYRFFNYLFLITVAFKCYVFKVDRSISSRVYVGLSIAYALYNFYGYMHSDLMPFYKNYHSFLFQ